MYTLGQRIKQLRLSEGLTQEDFGKLFGIVKSTVSLYENDKSTPDDETKIKICTHFNVSMDYLMGIMPNVSPNPIDIDNGIIGKKIKEFRERKGLTQKELAADLNMSASAIGMYEQGRRIPDVETLQHFSNFFRVSIDELLGESPTRFIKQDDKYKVLIKTNGLQVGTLVPILGSIHAGYPMLAEENIEGYMFIDKPNAEDYFYLRVTGDSMINAGIPDGSLALIHSQSYAENGDIVACMVDEEHATLKRFRKQGRTVVLIPENSSYDPIILNASEFDSDHGRAHILGVLKAITIQY